MENLEKKSLIQKLKQNSKNILYSLALLIISGLLIAYASRKIDSLDNNIKAASGDELSYEWVNNVNTEFKNLKDRVTVLEGGTSGAAVACGTAHGKVVSSVPKVGTTETCINGSVEWGVKFMGTSNISEFIFVWRCNGGGVVAKCSTQKLTDYSMVYEITTPKEAIANASFMVSDASQNCNDSTEGGHDDWYLPGLSITEISLVKEKFFLDKRCYLNSVSGRTYYDFYENNYVTEQCKSSLWGSNPTEKFYYFCYREKVPEKGFGEVF